MFVVHRPWSIVKADKKRPNWQRTVSPKKLEALSARQTKKTTQAIIDSTTTLRTELPSDLEIADAWAEYGYSGIAELLEMGEAADSFAGAAESLGETMGLVSQISLGSLPPGMQDKYRFDYTNPRIERIWQRRAGEKIVQPIVNGTLDSVRDIVHRQFTQGLTPRDLAGEIKNCIGLYPRLTRAHTNYVNGLKTQGMTEDRIAALSEKYYDKLLSYRAMTIARTETNFMLNRGQLEVWKQGQENGVIPQGAQKTWITDGNPCPECAAMDGEQVGLNEIWVMSDGTPCDVPTDSHPNCECMMTIDYGDIENAEFSEPESSDDEDDSIEKSDFDDSKHPRDERGRFAAGSSGEKKDGDYASKFSHDEKYSIAHYSGLGYGEVNGLLRGNKIQNEDEAKEHIKNLDSAMNKTSTESDQTVYRGMYDTPQLHSMGESSVGKTIEMPTYWSTTTDKSVAESLAFGSKGVLFEINVPKGSRAIEAEHFKSHSVQGKEKELILPRGGKYKITGYKKQGKKSVYKLEVI